MGGEIRHMQRPIGMFPAENHLIKPWKGRLRRGWGIGLNTSHLLLLSYIGNKRKGKKEGGKYKVGRREGVMFVHIKVKIEGRKSA